MPHDNTARIPAPLAGASRLSARQLRRRYLVALSLIALLTLLSQAVVQLLIADQQHDSRVVNMAGRQRMLSQQITKLGYHIADADSPATAAHWRQELTHTLDQWQRAHLGLQHGDLELGLPGHNSPAIQPLFERIQPHHQSMVAAAQALLASADQPALLAPHLAQISAHESAFLKGMDDIVFLYDQEATAKVTLAKWLELGLLGITLLVLLLEAVFIFAPATRRIAHDMNVLAQREEDMERLFAVSPTALLLVDRQHLTVWRANQRAIDLLGLAMERITGSNLRNYLCEDYATNRDFLTRISQGDHLNEYEVVLLDTQQSLLETLVSVREISFAGQPVFVLGITNITDLKKAQQTLEHHATFDEMTGLMNRRTGLMMLGKSMAGARRSGNPLTVCFVDLDGLKATNDQWGHAQGDALIRRVAHALTRVIRASDAAIRLGGDEFLLVLNDCSFDEGMRLMTRAEALLPPQEDQHAGPVGFSYGVATYAPEKHATPDALIGEADHLMYLVKRAKKMAAGTD